MILQKGTEGQQVRLWQLYCCLVGVPCKVDGNFGSLTETATLNVTGRAYVSALELKGAALSVQQVGIEALIGE